MVGIATSLRFATVLVSLCAHSAWCERLARPGSTHPSFPMDAFAKPTFKLVYDDQHPISNQTALERLQASKAKLQNPNTGIGEYKAGEGGGGGAGLLESDAAEVYLHRSSPTSLHLCSVPHPREEPGTALFLNESSLKEHRRRIVQNALNSLSPLKGSCLYHTLDWFTYSLCYGDSIRQFRALPGTTTGLVVPKVDETQDSYVLGRWNERIEAAEEWKQLDDRSMEEGEVASSDRQGSELMELVHFSSLEGSSADRGEMEEEGRSQSQTTIEGKGRYISQIWTDGTKCKINNELRTAEVQFHCSQSPAIDRISLIKEVTTCNYVVVIDTPKICGEPALAHVEDEVREVRCQPILSDEALERKYRSALEGIDGARKDSPLLSAAGSEKTPQEPAKEDHIFGRDVLKASLESIMNRINSGVGEATSELEVVIGWDEDGKFIIQPNKEGHKLDMEKLLESSASQGEDLEDQGDMDAKSKDRLDLLMEKLLQLEDEIFKAEDAEQPSGSQSEQPEAPQADSRGAGNGVEDGKGEKVQVEGHDATAPSPTAALPETPSRTNQMVRETENFAQRVERFYRAQEAQKQKDRDNQEDREGKPEGAIRQRDEL